MPVWSIVVWHVRPIAPVAYPTQVTVAHDAVPGNKKPIYIFKLIYTKEHERYQLHVATINIYTAGALPMNGQAPDFRLHIPIFRIV